jgi:hypothetical protein
MSQKRPDRIKKDKTAHSTKTNQSSTKIHFRDQEKAYTIAYMQKMLLISRMRTTSSSKINRVTQNMQKAYAKHASTRACAEDTKSSSKISRVPQDMQKAYENMLQLAHAQMI